MFENLRADIREARKINVGPDWWNQHVMVLSQPGMAEKAIRLADPARPRVDRRGRESLERCQPMMRLLWSL